MNLHCIGLDFKSADLETRVAAIKLTDDLIRNGLGDFREYLFLKTCNRVELYIVADGSPLDWRDRWVTLAGLSEDAHSHFWTLSGVEVIRHLFRVASSLESMVVGETQILGQVKSAYDKAVQQNSIGPVLHRIFQKSFKIAKKVRSETEVGRFPVSIPSIAVKLAETVIGQLGERCVGIVGLGEMGRLAADYFCSVQPKKILLYNRTTAISEDIHNKLRVQYDDVEIVDSLESLLKNADIICSAVDAPLIKSQELHLLCEDGREKFVIDLSVPPSVERLEKSGLFIFGVDDLQTISQENSKLRIQEVMKAEELVNSEVGNTWRTLRGLDFRETLKDLENKMSQLRLDELRHLKLKLKDMREDHWSEIEKMTERLTSRMIQDPIRQVRLDLESESESDGLIHFFRNLFKI